MVDLRVRKNTKVFINWSANFSYAIGLLATDGCVYKDGKRVAFVSKDYDQIENLMKCLKISCKVGLNISGNKKSTSYKVQFVDPVFVTFLKSIGIEPNKSKTISKIKIPDEFFFDFIRGCFDGDGSIYSYWDKRWKKSFMFYVSFASASIEFINWVQEEIYSSLKITGHVTSAKGHSTHQLKYAKSDSINFLRAMYYRDNILCLRRKRLKVCKILDIVKTLK
jgi:hypothetical protein